MKLQLEKKIIIIGLLLVVFTAGCLSRGKAGVLKESVENIYVHENKVNITFAPSEGNASSYLIYEKQTHLAFPKLLAPVPFRRDFYINPNMKNIAFFATVQKDGKVIREYSAQKTAETIIGTKKNAWSPSRTKLSLIIPYVGSEEEVFITTRYEWMDTRWLIPIELEDMEYTKSAQLDLLVPLGITVHFQAAIDRKSTEMLPTSSQINLPLWQDDKISQGLGTKHVFKYNNSSQNKLPKVNPSDRLQVFLSFESPISLANNSYFDNWDKISNYLHDKIDRFYIPNKDIKEFTEDLIKNDVGKKEKLFSIFNFLKDGVENRNLDIGFQNQEVQLASKTFSRKTGNAYDIAILGKSMCLSADLSAEIVAVGNRLINPKINFFTPALFNNIVLVANIEGENYFFDANNYYNNFQQIAPDLQGQNALVLNEENGYLFSMPVDDPEMNQENLFYELNINPKTNSSGYFHAELTGLFSQKTQKIDLQNLLFLTSDAKFKLGAITQNIPDNISTSFSGFIEPFLLKSLENDKFLLETEFLLEPLIRTSNFYFDDDFSKSINISIKINFPTEYRIESLPETLNFSQANRSGYILVEPSDNSINIQAGIRAKLPRQTTEQSEEQKNFYNNLKQPLIINKALVEPIIETDQLFENQDSKK